MSALGHYLEAEGIPTVSISLIREHTVALKAPRALWVPFMLGRPYGVPNDAAFQRKVALSALRLLERTDGPVLEDFPDDAPYEDLGDVPEAENCPVSFPRMRSDGTLGERLADEIAQLQAWHEVARRQNGRTTLGVLAAGEAIVAMRDHAAQSADRAMKGLATLSLVPRAVLPLLAERGAG